MADTWSRIYTLAFTTIVNQVVTDGTDIFFEFPDTDARSIYKYDVALNTHSKLTDGSAFTATSPRSAFVDMIVFRGNIYCALIDDDGIGTTDPYVRVYRVNPSTGGVTVVNDTFPHSAAVDVGGGDVDQAFVYLYSTEDVIVCSYREQAHGPETSEHISQYSYDGTNWTTATNSYAETIELQSSAADARSAGKDYRTLGIYDSFPTDAGEIVFLHFDSGVWSKVYGPVTLASPIDRVWETAADYIWLRNDFGEYTSDFATFPTPSSLSGQMVGLNMPWAVCQDFWSTDHKIYKINTASPPNLVEDSRIVGTGLTTTGSPINTMIRLNSGNTLGFFKSFDASFPNWSIWQRSANLAATPGAWGGNNFPDLSPTYRPADVSADGAYLFIGLLIRGGTPALFKLDTDLDTAPTVVFDPQAGTSIGVQCGRFDADVVWIAGDFDDTTVQKSGDQGDSFTQKDGGAVGIVLSFVVGPDDDNRVLAFDTANNQIYETIDSGDNWTLLNNNTGFNINALARLSINVQEIVTGNESGVSDNVDYSPNSGIDLTDTNFPVAQDVTGIIVN